MFSPFLPDLAALPAGVDVTRDQPCPPGKRCCIRPVSVQHMIEMSMIATGDRSWLASTCAQLCRTHQVARLGGYLRP